MGTGAREVARMLRMRPNTDRDYREALKKEGLLEGAAQSAVLLLKVLEDLDLAPGHPAGEYEQQELQMIREDEAPLGAATGCPEPRIPSLPARARISPDIS